MSLFSSQIVNMNNQALHQLMQGNLDETVGTLGIALSNLKAVRDLESLSKKHSCLPIQPEEDGKWSLQSLAVALMRINSSDDAPPMSSIPLSLQPPTGNHNSIFSLFPRALTITTPNPGHTDRIMAMLLYNMGLALHVEALRQGPKSYDEISSGALQLYEMAFSVVEDAWAQFDVEDLLLLLMALLSNMGHIHSSRFDQTRTKVCLDWLTTLASNPMFQNLMNQQPYQPFYMDLLVTLRQKGHVCSPAA